MSPCCWLAASLHVNFYPYFLLNCKLPIHTRETRNSTHFLSNNTHETVRSFVFLFCSCCFGVQFYAVNCAEIWCIAHGTLKIWHQLRKKKDTHIHKPDETNLSNKIGCWKVDTEQLFFHSALRFLPYLCVICLCVSVCCFFLTLFYFGHLSCLYIRKMVICWNCTVCLVLYWND